MEKVEAFFQKRIKKDIPLKNVIAMIKYREEYGLFWSKEDRFKWQ